MLSFYSPDIEHHFLGLLMQYPELWADVSFISEKDFHPVRQQIFSVIRLQLESVPRGEITPLILSEKLKTYGQTTIENVDIYNYLDGVRNLGKLIKKDEITSLSKQLKIYSVKRELIDKCDQAKIKIAKSDSFDTMVGAVDDALTSVNVDYYKTNETHNIFDNLINTVEERGNSPLDPANIGYGGVFPSIDRALGSPIGKGHFVNVTARQATGKSSFAFFYAVTTAEKYDLPILWVDAGEMTAEQLQMRAVCCLSKGRVPLWAIRSGQWRLNEEWERIVRKDVWPRVKKLKLYYRSVGSMSPKEKVAYMRRFYFNKIGRGNFLIIVDDYLKGVEKLTKDSSEWQGVGYYVSDVKNLVTDEIDASFWTSTQANRSGIVKGKKLSEIVDNDSVVSLSDRINHNATHAFLLRYKTYEELALEKNFYGNIVLKLLKIRDGLGMDYEKFMQPIKVGNGYAENYFNIDYHGFHYTDKGWYSEMLQNLGHTSIDLRQASKSEDMP